MATVSWVPDRRQVLLFTYELKQNPRFPDTETDREKFSVSSNSSSLQDLSLTSPHWPSPQHFWCSVLGSRVAESSSVCLTSTQESLGEGQGSTQWCFQCGIPVTHERVQMCFKSNSLNALLGIKLSKILKPLEKLSIS